MKFSEVKYERKDASTALRTIVDGIAQLGEEVTAEAQIRVIREITRARNLFEGLSEYVYIRTCQDIHDSFYSNEQRFFDEYLAIYEEAISRFYSNLLESPLRSRLISEFGRQFLAIAATKCKTISKDAIKDIQSEKKAVSSYWHFLGDGSIRFEGEGRTYNEIETLTRDRDPIRRKGAWIAKYAFLNGKRDAIEARLAEITALRIGISEKLGYKSFIDLAYARLRRTEYGPSEIAAYRKNVENHILPLLRSEMGLWGSPDAGVHEKAFDYDVSIQSFGFRDIISEFKKTLSHACSQGADFLAFMHENELFDLGARPEKRTDGFCHYINHEKLPFIFASLGNGPEDLLTFAHECGHGLQLYLSRKFDLPEYKWPTNEAAEMHSIFMETLAQKWADAHLGPEGAAFKKTQIRNSLLTLVEFCRGDEFLHFYFENPRLPAAIHAQKWVETGKKYLVWKDPLGIPFLQEGRGYSLMPALVSNPFYYIDYSLATFCALQMMFKAEAGADREIWDAYLEMCGAGGSISFFEMLSLGKIGSPFEESSFISLKRNLAIRMARNE